MAGLDRRQRAERHGGRLLAQNCAVRVRKDAATGIRKGDVKTKKRTASRGAPENRTEADGSESRPLRFPRAQPSTATIFEPSLIFSVGTMQPATDSPSTVSVLMPLQTLFGF